MDTCKKFLNKTKKSIFIFFSNFLIKQFAIIAVFSSIFIPDLYASEFIDGKEIEPIMPISYVDPKLPNQVDNIDFQINILNPDSLTVELSFEVKADGSVSNIETIRGKNPILVNSAKDAVSQWKYAKRIKSEKKSIVTVTFNFSQNREEPQKP
jgi:hypothetical protein